MYKKADIYTAVLFSSVFYFYILKIPKKLYMLNSFINEPQLCNRLKNTDLELSKEIMLRALEIWLLF